MGLGLDSGLVGEDGHKGHECEVVVPATQSTKDRRYKFVRSSAAEHEHGEKKGQESPAQAGIGLVTAVISITVVGKMLGEEGMVDVHVGSRRALVAIVSSLAQESVHSVRFWCSSGGARSLMVASLVAQ